MSVGLAGISRIDRSPGGTAYCNYMHPYAYIYLYLIMRNIGCQQYLWRIAHYS